MIATLNSVLLYFREIWVKFRSRQKKSRLQTKSWKIYSFSWTFCTVHLFSFLFNLKRKRRKDKPWKTFKNTKKNKLNILPIYTCTTPWACWSNGFVIRVQIFPPSCSNGTLTRINPWIGTQLPSRFIFIVNYGMRRERILLQVIPPKCLFCRKKKIISKS